MNELTPKVDKLVLDITSGRMPIARIRALYSRLGDQERLLDEDRDRLVSAIESHVRSTAPRVGNVMFGPKDGEARLLLGRLWAKLSANHDLSGNAHVNAVKAGGTMIGGANHLDVYVSYRASNGEAVVLTIFEETPKSGAKVRLQRSIGAPAQE